MLDADFRESAKRGGVDVARRFRPGAHGFPLVAQARVDDGLGEL
jgi:hypothetical protein